MLMATLKFPLATLTSNSDLKKNLLLDISVKLLNNVWSNSSDFEYLFNLTPQYLCKCDKHQTFKSLLLGSYKELQMGVLLEIQRL